MNGRNQDQKRKAGIPYRLEVRGAISAGWARWFGADTVTPAGLRTVIELRVADQSELYGRLRRIHDLNLQLISVLRLDAGSESAHVEPAALREGMEKNTDDGKDRSDADEQPVEESQDLSDTGSPRSSQEKERGGASP